MSIELCSMTQSQALLVLRKESTLASQRKERKAVFMGSKIELNDTLQITTEQGFPKELILEKHLKHPFKAEEFKGKIFSFNKPDIRIFLTAPSRVFLVHNINGKWLYWGHCQIIEQTIHAESKTTSGKFVIIKIYSPEHQKSMSINEVDPGKEFF